MALDKETFLAIRRLQIHILTNSDHEPTLRDLVVEGIGLLLEKSGLEPMKRQEEVKSRATSISIEQGAKQRAGLDSASLRGQQGC